MTDSIIIKRRLAGSLGGKIRAELARLRMSSKRSIDDFRAQLRSRKGSGIPYAGRLRSLKR